jgi:adenylate cyclase
MVTDEPRQHRQLHGVLLADVTGYSRLMGEDERRAMAALARVRSVFTDVVPRHAGTLEVFVGDCFVALFPSAVDAVLAAVEIQRGLASGEDGVRIRIGVHLGEVVRSAEGVFGDSINVTARIQSIAQPGGVAVSADVYRAVRNKVDLPFQDWGPQDLKNIRDRVHVYAIALDGAPAPRPASAGAPRRWPAVVAAALVVGLAGAGGALLLRGGTPPWRGGDGGAPAEAARAQAPTADAPVVVGVMGITARGAAPDWMREITRDGLNTVLSKAPGVRVFSRQKIDFLREKRGLSELEVAEQLGIGKMLSGSLAMDGDTVMLEVQVVDIASGLLDASERVDGRAGELIELQNQVAENVLGALHVTLTPEDRRVLFAKRTNETLDAYRMLTDTFGSGPPPDRPKPTGSWLSPFVATAFADDAEAAITQLIERYRAALEAKDVAALEALHVEMTPQTREALQRYFESAKDLKVGVTDVDVLVEGDDALVTFSRKDDFVDARSGQTMHLEVRLSSELTRSADGSWKLRGVKKG